MKVFVVRHGETDWNKHGYAQGHTDISLNSDGRRQGQLLSDHLLNIPIDRIFCSDLKRCRETIATFEAAVRTKVEVRADLRERSFGEWEGRHFTDLHAALRDLGENTGLDTSEVRPPGGESFADVWNRVGPFLDEIETLSGNVLVVTHGGTAGVIIARMILATVKTCRSFRFGNTGLTELERRNDNGYMIRRLNDLRHLGEEFER